MEIDSPPAKEGKSPEEIVFYYAPKGFLLLMSYGVAALLGYQRLVVEKLTGASSYLSVIAIGFSLMFVIPTVYYLVINRNELKAKMQMLLRRK